MTPNLRAYGPADGPVTVVLPGLGVSRYLRRSSRTLAERTGSRVLLVEPPGFGSPLDGTPTLDTVVPALEPWLASLGPVSVLGQSTGCLLAARLAGRVPLKDLALFGPVMDPIRRTLPTVAAAWASDGRNEPLRTILLEAPDWVRNARGIYPYLRSCLEAALEDDLAAVDVPVTVVRGELDPLSSHAWAASLADAPGRRLVVMPGGAHTFMVGRPELVPAALVA